MLPVKVKAGAAATRAVRNGPVQAAADELQVQFEPALSEEQQQAGDEQAGSCTTAA